MMLECSKHLGPSLKVSESTVYFNTTSSCSMSSKSDRPSFTIKPFIIYLMTISVCELWGIGGISVEGALVGVLSSTLVEPGQAALFFAVLLLFILLLFLLTLIQLYFILYCQNRARQHGDSAGDRTQNLWERELGIGPIRTKSQPQTGTGTPLIPPSSHSVPNQVQDPTEVPTHKPTKEEVTSSIHTECKKVYMYYQQQSANNQPASVPPSTTSDNEKTFLTLAKMAREFLYIRFLASLMKRVYEIREKIDQLTFPPTWVNYGVTDLPIKLKVAARRAPAMRGVRGRAGPQGSIFPQKGHKKEGDLLPPMSMEESTEAFEHLGIYPQIEQWRDRLRQWFSSMLLKPLLNKIDTSHTKVMQAANKLGITITVSQVGNETPDTGTASISTIGRTNEWKPTFSVDEDGLLHQLRVTLVNALDSYMPKSTSGGLQPSSPQNSLIPILQECIDAITEHQKLHSLMKGEWGKGLLPQNGVRAEYTVQRIRELAEGTCLRNYDYLGSVEGYKKGNQKWNLDLPTDSHLLLYLFCAFLEHPKWMLHVDPTAYAGTQSSKNPLFLGVLPPKERFPEKYVAVVSGVPSVLHPGACILAVGKQSPPVFALYWDKKPQFSLQASFFLSQRCLLGRTALWDSILLLCYKIKTGYGGLVRGMHLSSSALGILPVLDSEKDDC
ncbi:hypothetical protein RND71_025383 [Anisodus tanguticus]|uniref:Transmembrane protein 209 n=1 Tax=Anisodus tanguticus TaxID=243964 RepID=A0AAE1RS66_9SOLA|nr:hypothetical protein RND71_025383 [Anisodus tanguticus]